MARSLPTLPRLPEPTRLAALTAIALSIVVTWPLLLSPIRRIAGHPGNDNWNHVWGYWWVGENLARGSWPTHTDLLSHPRGGTLYFIDTIQAVLSWPLQWVGGPALAYNFVVIIGLAFSAFAAWLLVNRLAGDPLCAGLAMVIYGLAPHLLGQAYNGISETVCAGWFPFTLWCLIRVLDRPTLKRGLALGLAAATCLLTSWYYGLFAAIGSFLLLVWQAARQPYVINWRRTIPVLLLAVSCAFLVVLPFFLAFQSSLEAADALVTRDPEFVQASLINHNITDIIAFFRPSRTASPDLLALYGEQLLIVIYLGWPATLLAVFALIATRRRREFAPWVWLGLTFFLFSLGPYLNVGGEYLELEGRRLPLPFLFLFEAMPVFDRISHPFRFVVGVSLMLAVLAAQGLRHLLRKQPERRRVAVVLGLSALILVEYLTSSPAHLPLPSSDARIPVAYEDIGADPAPGAVLDLPLTVPNLERAIYVWYQTVHDRPVPWGLNDPMPRGLLANRLTTTLIRMEAIRAQTMPPHLPELDLVIGARMLARQEYRYIVVHEVFYPAFKLDHLETLMVSLFGEPRRYPEDHLQVYRLEWPEDTE